jgi:hypothetical protein
MTDAAIEHYQAAGTHRMDVPRMLFDLNRTGKLLEYVDGRREPELYKWWAQYCESHGKFDKVRGATHAPFCRLSPCPSWRTPPKALDFGIHD